MKTFAKRWLLPPGFHDLMNSARHRLSRLRLSAEDRRLLDGTTTLLGRHAGQRCFLLGGGSSIARQDLAKLRGEVVISVSNTFVHPLFREIRPRYHVVPPMLSSHGRYYDAAKFVVWLREMESGTAGAEMVFHIGDRAMIQGSGLFQGRTIHWVDYCPWTGDFDTPLDLARIPNIWSVSELAVTLGVYLGFDRIYTIGFDHDWFNGVMVYFYDHTKQHAMRPHETNLDRVDAEFQMRRHADIFRKYKYLYSIRKNIFNANADSRHYMDVFPKVDFDSLFDVPIPVPGDK